MPGKKCGDRRDIPQFTTRSSTRCARCTPRLRTPPRPCRLESALHCRLQSLHELCRPQWTPRMRAATDYHALRLRFARPQISSPLLVLSIQRTRIVPPLPYVPTRSMQSVPVGCKSAMRLLQRQRQGVRFPRDRNQVHMVRHQAVAHHRQPV